jgi:hypothetical protein
MTSQRHSFIVPGDEMVKECGDELLTLLQKANVSWEEFLCLCLNAIMDHVNRHGVELLEEYKGLGKQERFAYCEEFLAEVLVGLDLMPQDSEFVNDYLAEYRILEKSIVAVFDTAMKYIPLILNEPRFAPDKSVPFEITIARTIGYDVVFSVGYLYLSTKKESP